VLRDFLPVIDTILLDIDGTLVDSNDAHAYAWVEALGKSGIHRTFADVRPLIGMGADLLLPQVDPYLSSSLEPGMTAALREGEIFKECYLDSLEPMPGARALLEQLKRQAVRCVIATSARNEQLDDLLKLAGIGDLIDARATASDAARSKPSADTLHAALLVARARASNSVMLGDTKYDIQAAHAAGIPAISLRCGGSSEIDLSDSAATFETPLDLAAALETSSLREIVATAQVPAPQMRIVPCQ
jgi:HAD superfamily hydrolase (TIGR01509 family)